MTTTIKKGTEVYIFGDYNHSNKCCVSRATITSFGKVQGTAVHSRSGKNYKSRFYAREAHKTVVPVADVPDVYAEAMRRAVEIKAYWQRHYYNRCYLQQDASDAYLKAIAEAGRRQLDTVPEVVFLNF